MYKDSLDIELEIEIGRIWKAESSTLNQEAAQEHALSGHIKSELVQEYKKVIHDLLLTASEMQKHLL
jgi:hypothetical protein